MTRLLCFSTLLATLLLTLSRAKLTTSPQLKFGLDVDAEDLTSSAHVANTEFTQLWAQYSPYFAAQAYPPPPTGCQITQVNILQRHGARFPTSGAGALIELAVAKLQAVPNFTDPTLAFIHNFTYTLGHDDLIAFGAKQSFDSAFSHFARYGHLVNESSLPFVRAASSVRVVDSANNWTAGFAAASQNNIKPFLNLILPESQNITLDDNMCPNQPSLPNATNFQTTYTTPILERLRAVSIPQSAFDLTPTDISSLISLCAFESVANGPGVNSGTSEQLSLSPWCNVFKTEEFAGFLYANDLSKFYSTGYGNPLGRVQGVGYVNELIGRLTHTFPTNDRTQTNQTLDTNPATFPLDRTLYIDFSHDNQMIAIYSALGLFPQPKDMPLLSDQKPDPHRNWVTSKQVPFSARMTVEKLSCPSVEASGHSVHVSKTDFVRVLVDDALRALDFCRSSETPIPPGLCKLDDFVQSQSYARSNGEGDFEKCGFVLPS